MRERRACLLLPLRCAASQAGLAQALQPPTQRLHDFPPTHNSSLHTPHTRRTSMGYDTSFLANRFSMVPSTWRTSPSHGRTCSSRLTSPQSTPCSGWRPGLVGQVVGLVQQAQARRAPPSPVALIAELRMQRACSTIQLPQHPTTTTTTTTPLPPACSGIPAAGAAAPAATQQPQRGRAAPCRRCASPWWLQGAKPCGRGWVGGAQSSSSGHTPSNQTLSGVLHTSLFSTWRSSTTPKQASSKLQAPRQAGPRHAAHPHRSRPPPPPPAGRATSPSSAGPAARPPPAPRPAAARPAGWPGPEVVRAAAVVRGRGACRAT